VGIFDFRLEEPEGRRSIAFNRKSAIILIPMYVERSPLRRFADMPLSLLALLLLAITPAFAQSTDTADADDMLLDATYVPCGDSTESLYVFHDGRVIYAASGQGTIFTINGPLLNDLQGAVERAQSLVDTKFLDSCTTLGVILDGPRFLLINNKRPTPETREMQIRLERIRKFAQRKLGKAMEKLVDKAAEPPDTSYVQPQPSLRQRELRRHVRLSPIAQQWRCRGSVIVAAKIGWNGEVREAFVQSARVRGKCAAVLTVSALRAIMLTTFTPALNASGKPTSVWTSIEVPFGRGW
jgi:hypothetical protein